MNPSRLLGLVPAALVGAGVAYLLDPQQGRRRRALIRDRFEHWRHELADAAEVARHDLSNRATGVLAQARGALRSGQADDRVLEARLRSRLGAVVSHPKAVTVSVQNGQADIAGDVLASEEQALVAALRRVRGVQGVEHAALRTHESPDGVPALQGEGRAGGGARMPPASRAVIAGGLALVGSVLAARTLAGAR